MTTYSPAQVAVVAKGAGFTGNSLVRAVAVALAESGGNTSIRGKADPRDRGLWQINSRWHPDVSDAEAFNPQTAARHAYRISKSGTDWSPWTTHKNGMADAQMARATMAARQATGNPNLTVTPVVGIPGFDLPGWANPLDGDIVPGPNLPDLSGVTEALSGIGKAAAGIASLAVKASIWLSNWRNWIRIAQVIGGGAALLIGLRMLANSNIGGPVGTAARGANKVTKTAGKATKLVGETAAMAATGGASKVATTAGKAAKGAKTAAKTAKGASAAKAAGAAKTVKAAAA